MQVIQGAWMEPELERLGMWIRGFSQYHLSLGKLEGVPGSCLFPLSLLLTANAGLGCCPASVVYSVTSWSRSPCGKAHVLPLWVTHASVGCHMMEFGVGFLFASP